MTIDHKIPIGSRDQYGKVIYKSSAYIVGNTKPKHNFCLEDGCYYFTLYDDVNKNQWELIALNSTVNIDGNDGSINGSNTDGFNVFTPKIFTSNVNVNIKDPSSFIFNARANQNVNI